MKKLFIALMLICLPSLVQAQQLETICVQTFAPNGSQSCQPVNIGYNNQYKNIAAGATTLVKSGSGSLHSINVNNKGSTVTITIYDSLTASGTKIATMTLTAEGTQTFDVSFSTGLTVVTSGTADITVSYR
jgi:hypothetical protein